MVTDWPSWTLPAALGGGLAIYAAYQYLSASSKRDPLDALRDTLEESLVRPLHPLESFEEPVSALDQSLAPIFIQFALRFDVELDVDVLRDALAETLDEFPAAAGRLDTSRKVNAIVGAAGVSFKVQTCGDVPPGDDSSQKAWDAARLVPPRTQYAPPDAAEPLLQVLVSRFPAQRVTVLGITISHVLGDAGAYAAFLRAWDLACARRAAGGPRHGAEAPPQVRAGGRVDPGRAPFAGTKEEVWAAWDETPYCPLRPWGMTPAIPKIMWAMSTTEDVVLRVDGARLDAIKRAAGRRLGAEAAGGGPSSGEVLIALLASLHAAARGPPRAAGRQLGLRVMTDLRAPRTGLHGAEHFGNACALTPSGAVALPPGGRAPGCIPADLEAEDLPEGLTHAVAAVHGGVRAALAQGDALGAPNSYMEDARDAGLGDKMGNISGYQFFCHPDDVFFNKWGTRGWYDLRMGAGSDVPGKGGAVRMLAAPGAMVPPGLYLILPRNDRGDLTVFARMGAEEARQFRAEIERCGMPFASA